MPANPKKSVPGKEHGFTLIELIIVVVIVGILAMVAIPRYFANVAKAQKAQIYSNLRAILNVSQNYFAVNGAWPAKDTFPIIVTVDGETVSQISNPSTDQWWYWQECEINNGVTAIKQPGNSCYYRIWCDGTTFQTCTP